jgi:hypothetical protein
MVNILLNAQQITILQQVCDYIGPQVSDIITCELPNLDKLVADWKDINRQLDTARLAQETFGAAIDAMTDKELRILGIQRLYPKQ